ncbi:MAG TPA: c-type cytochrome [Chryseosolibacter sp.]|nr:c-type cytochrome [Chryseosolibacter sp.]
MKKVIKIILLFVVVVAVGITGFIGYVKLALPDVGEAPELKVDLTAERIERGRYLANSVTICMDCHSNRDWSKFSGPIIPGTFGKGGDRFDHSVGFPGVYHAKNITPAGISRYTDGELYRVITTGVNKEGKAMFPVMPYRYYGKMDQEDIYSIIAYIRSLEPIENQVAESESDFPMNIIINTIPEKPSHVKRPDPSDEVAYGGYMVNASGCIECHTQVDQGQIIPELAFGGGREFNFPDGSTIRSSNISPDDETGLGKWTKEMFVQRFKMYADSSYVLPNVQPGEFNSIMPWTMYSSMKEQDLAAIYAYLRSVKPINNRVVKFSPAMTVAAN